MYPGYTKEGLDQYWEQTYESSAHTYHTFFLLLLKDDCHKKYCSDFSLILLLIYMYSKSYIVRTVW